jgi:tetratricopeptide (TPR) repeat protein
MLEESLAIFQTMGDRRGTAYALGALSLIVGDLGQLERAERLARESVAIHRETGHLHMMTTSLIHLGWALIVRGKYAENHSVLEEILEICKELGMRRHTAQTYGGLGLADLHLGQYKRARIQAEMGLVVARENDDPSQVAFALHTLGCVALAEGAYVDAQALLQETSDFYRDAGLREMLGYDLAFLAIASRKVGQTPQARRCLCEALQIANDMRPPRPLSFILPAISLILVDQGEPERAVELYALASRYPQVANSRLFEDVVGKHIDAAAAALPPEVVAAAQERGRARDRGEAVEELLEELNA